MTRHPKNTTIDSGKREIEADVAKMQKMFDEIKASNPGLDIKPPSSFMVTTAKPMGKSTAKV